MRARTLALVAGLAVLGGGGAWLAVSSGSPSDVPLAEPAGAGASELEARNRDIVLFAARARQDPYSAADRSRLAYLLLQRGRETGDYEDYRRAEAASRASLSLRGERNAGALLTLSSSLLAQHRFAEALAAARELVAREPEKPSYRALLGEILLEMGDYDAARGVFGSLESARDNLAVAPRLARWAEVEGRTADARRILYSARDQAAARTDLPREQAAWFYLRSGDLELRNGRLGAAERELRAGLALRPGDPRLLSALARVRAARGRWSEVVRLGAEVGDAADLATLALLGDAHAALGDAGRAEELYRRVEDRAAANPEPFNRQWTQFRLDHGRHLPETLALLREESRTRHDVLGYDMLAWALYRTGDHAGAGEAAARALRMGTRDAALHFHAGMILRAQGRRAEARAHLEKALEINPYFPQAGEAREALREPRG